MNLQNQKVTELLYFQNGATILEGDNLKTQTVQIQATGHGETMNFNGIQKKIQITPMLATEL